MNQKYTTLKIEKIEPNPYWNYVIEEYVLPNLRTGKYYYVDSNGSTVIIPRKKNGKFIMTKQYRYLNKEYSIEFPGGGIKKGLTAEENAREELQQETGLVADKLTLLGKFNPCNGMTNEICWVFLAEELRLSESRPDDSEEFEIFELSLHKILDKIKKGEIWDGMTLASWSIYYFYFA